MRIRLPLVVLALSLSLTAFLFHGAGFSFSNEDELARADRHFQSKNYKQALKSYQLVLNDGERPIEDAGLAFLQAARCHVRLKKWDDGIALLASDTLKRFDGSIWGARALALRGSVTLTMPHYYYKKKDLITRDRWIQGATYHHTKPQDIRSSLKLIEKATLAFGPFLEKGILPPGNKELTTRVAEYVRMSLHMVQALEEHRSMHGGFNGAELHKGTLDDLREHDLCRTLGHDPVIWLERAEHMALLHKEQTAASLARYELAMFCKRLLTSGVNVHKVRAGDINEISCVIGTNEKDEPILAILPKRLNPFARLKSFLKDYPKSPWADDAALAHGILANERGLYVGSLAAVKGFEKRYPKSQWLSDVLSLRQSITYPELTFQSKSSHLPGAPVKLTLSTRNIAEVQFTAEPVDLEKLFLNPRFLKDRNTDLSNVERNLQAFLRRRSGAAFTENPLTLRTADRAEHKRHKKTATLDLSQPGAYIVQAKGGGITVRNIVVISKLALVRKISDTETVVFVADANTGEAIEGAKVIVRQSHRANGLFGRYRKVTFDDGVTDKSGLFTRGHSDSSFNRIDIEAFASYQGHHVMSPKKNFNGIRRTSTQTKVHAYTDRPVYRPGDPVHFKAHVCSQNKADYEVMRNTRLKVTIKDAKRNVIFDQALTTDEYGALWAEVTLGEEPPLGSYRIEYRLEGRYLHRHSFRVEEYKLPEYEVAVSGPEEQVRSGGMVTATVHGEYYSGGGVPEAKVVWRVYRRSYYPVFQRNDPWAWLYGRRGNTRRGGRGRELVSRGEGVTDQSGDLMIEFSSKPWSDKYPLHDHVFTIEADMTDLSRRTISGSGETKVTRRGLFAAIFGERGFYQAGETLDLEVLCQNADGEPRESAGRFVVYRESRSLRNNEVVTNRTQVDVGSASTDESGRGRIKWLADSAGRFVVTYVTEDSWGEPVTAEYTAMIADVNTRMEEFQNKGIQIIADRTEYKPGDVAYLLINSQFTDQTVLLTMEADHEFLERRTFRIDGRSTVIKLPITEAHAPNIHMQVIGVHGGVFMATHQQIFVPPTHQFVDVAMEFDKLRYGPGELAKVSLRTTDHKGQAVPASVGLTVFDKALTYIQRDTTADIRQSFYGRLRGFHGNNSWGGNLANSSEFRFSSYQVIAPARKRYRTHGTPPGYWGHHEGIEEDYFFDGAVEKKGDLRGYLGLEVRDNEELSRQGNSRHESLEEEGASDSSRPTSGRAQPPGAVATGRFGGRGGLSSKRRSKSNSAKPRQSDAGGETAPVVVRENFADLAFWQANIETDTNGTATVEFRLPDTLTTWVARARGLSVDVRVGETGGKIQTAKDLLIRLQAPRFFTEQDEIVLSGVVRNDRNEAVDVETSLNCTGESIEMLGDAVQKITVKARSEQRVDWRVRVLAKGQVSVLLKALSQLESDAVSIAFPVLPYGIDKIVTQTAVLEDDATDEILIDLPSARRSGSGQLEVTLSPSMAGTLMEALPYLVEYPYGCTEQTLSRFLPAVVVARTLQEQGISLEDLKKRRADLDNTDALNLRKIQPVYTRHDLDKIVRAGLRRLKSMQNGNGGWGWWTSDRSTVHLTSYVLYGLSIARACDYPVPDSMIGRGVRWLEKELTEGKLAPYQKAYGALALTACGRPMKATLDELMKGRDKLSTLGKSWLALSLHNASRSTEAKLVVQNLDDFRLEDKANGTSHWAGASAWWRWWGDEVETNAFVLLAASTVNPETPWIDSLAKWLVYNRTGNRWKSTRDTAHAVLALTRFAGNAGEFDPDYTLKVEYPGQAPFEVTITKENMFTFQNTLSFEDDSLRDGAQKLKITKKGSGRLYFTSRLSYFSKEDRILASGHQIEVQRAYFAVTPKEVEKTRGNKTITVIEYDRTPLAFGARVEAGQEVEVRLTLKVANNYEYVLVEDRKPAGFEPLALRSGGRYANGLCSNMELRDEKVAFFVTWLQQGSHEITYRMRAEIPGVIGSMPCRAVAMYAPRLGGTSDSWRVTVSDAVR